MTATANADRKVAPTCLRPTRRRVFALPETRWAAASTGFFGVAALGGLAGLPHWLTLTLYAACYVTGGWEPALEGLRALREKTLDVDLLMVVGRPSARSSTAGC
jgi:cation transport ATPase